MSNWFDDDCLTQVMGRELLRRDTNRKLASLLTDVTRKAVHSNNLTVRLPWDENAPIVLDGTWQTAEIFSCGDRPTVVGTLDFRIDETIQLGRVRVTDREALAERRRARA